MARIQFLYHVYDDPAFNGLAALAPASIPVVPLAGGAPVPRQMFSLVRDMAELRRIGAAKTCLGAPLVDVGVTGVGQSHEPRDLLAVKVGAGSGHKVLVLGCHHAREWISVEMVFYIAEYLINTYTDTPSTPKEKRIKHLLMNRQIWFVPMVNPDGHVVSVTSNRDWRQNNHQGVDGPGSVMRAGRRVAWPANTPYQGVDLNRNYQTRAVPTAVPAPGKASFLAWGTETFLGSSVRTSRDPRDSNILRQIYCGPSAASESETAAIQALVGNNQFRSTISFHNSGDQWLWSGPLSTGSDVPFVDWVGNGTVGVMGTAGPGTRSYAYTGGPTPYPTSGDMTDYTFQTVPGWRPAYTPEVRPSSAEVAANPDSDFSGLLESEIEPCFRENLAATLAVINCAGHNAQSAAVTVNTATGDPPQRCQFVKKCWEVFRNWTP